MHARRPSVWSLLLIAPLVAGAGCGGGQTIGGTPFQRTDSGLPDLSLGDAPPPSQDAGASVDAAVDAAAHGDAGGAVVSVAVAVPADDAIAATAQRFVPTVTVGVAAAAGAASNDTLDAVVAELWSTGAGAKKLSSTPLALSSQSAGAAATTYVYAETPIDLSALASAAYELHVTATTVAGATGTAVRLFRADAGPTIVITKPVSGSSYKGSIAAQVTITDAIFAPISAVTMSVGGHDLTPTGPTGTPATQYGTLIDFDAYMPPLDGEQLFTVSAANSNGTTSTAAVRFVIDNQGPAITGTTPAAGDMVGSLITIAAQVADPAGVLDASVVAVVGHGDQTFTVKLDPDATTAGRYSHQFDTRLLDVHDLYPTISFRASDLLGNESSIGYVVALDNTPPLADLDPPSDLRVRVKGSGVWTCSWPFDPLGSDAVADGDLVAQLFDVRARVEDRGNTPYSGGADVIPVSLVDPARVELLVLSGAAQPLVVDSDGDGVCDKINPLLVPTTTPMSSSDALLVNMVPVAPSGTADLTLDPSIAADPSLDCVAGSASTSPEPLCLTTDLTIAIPYAASNEPAVWTLAPVVAGALQCVGNQFDAYANNIRDGWACLAVRAADKLGNMQVSRVLRVCVDHDGVGNECPHRAIAAVSNATPIAVTTAAPHGLTTGAEIIVSRSDVIAADGRWHVTVTGPTTFTLDGSAQDNLRPGNGHRGSWVPTSVLPDCTGTQTALQPPAITPATPCAPWGSYPTGEVRTLL
jgi:hypothetical protein